MNCNEMTFVGKKITSIRKSKGYNISIAARVCDIPRSTYNRIEIGDCDLSVANLVKICNAFGIDPNSLLSDFINLPKQEVREELGVEQLYLELIKKVDAYTLEFRRLSDNYERK